MDESRFKFDRIKSKSFFLADVHSEVNFGRGQNYEIMRYLILPLLTCLNPSLIEGARVKLQKNDRAFKASGPGKMLNFNSLTSLIRILLRLSYIAIQF